MFEAEQLGSYDLRVGRDRWARRTCYLISHPRPLAGARGYGPAIGSNGSNVHSAAEQLLALVEREDLPARESALRFLKRDQGRVPGVGIRHEFERDARIAVT